MGKRKATYYGATKAQLRKIKKWKFVKKVFTLGDEVATLETLENEGKIIKVKPIYGASMIYIGVL